MMWVLNVVTYLTWHVLNSHIIIFAIKIDAACGTEITYIILKLVI